MFNFLELIRSCLVFLGYVSTGGSFPQPIPPDEEKVVIEAMINGDPEARDKLVKHNLRLVAHIAKKYHSSGLDQDDMISIGTMGLIKAVRTYKANNGTALATYAARCIENEILMALRVNKKYKDDVSLNESIGIDKEGKDIDLLDVLGTDPEVVLNEVSINLDMRRVRKLLATKLTKRERIVVELRYGLLGDKSVPQREIAKKLGISRSYVSRIEKKAIEKLGEGLNSPDEDEE